MTEYEFDATESRRKARHARKVGARMMMLGWFVLVVGVLSMVTTVVLWLAGEESFDEALAQFGAFLLGTVLTGVATYGTGLNLTMNADRLEGSLSKT
ncbi:MAG: hypothetical protein U0W40_16165 [Acidimicrobiia bacterium]